MNKKVREEEVILFLDSRMNSKFDRDAFEELNMRLKQEGKKLTPYNFAQTYHLAFNVLNNK